MINDIVAIKFDEQLRMAVLEIGEFKPDTAAFLLPEGFQSPEVREALLMTGHVEVVGDALRLVAFANAERLSDLVSSILGTFDAPGIPGEKLLEVQAQLEDYQSGVESTVEIPLMAIAWLDVIVREDIAEEARSSNDIWSKPKFTVETNYHRERRIKELLKRYSRQPTSRPRIMTPSVTELSPSLPGQRKVFG